MKNELVICTLKDIASKEKGSIISGPFGSDISSKYFQADGIPVIRGNNLSNGWAKFIDEGFAYLAQEKADELDAYAVEDDLIFTAAGTIGQVGLIEKGSKYKKYVISNKQLRVRLDKDKINPLYAYYWFSSPWMVKDIVNKNTGSTVPLINLGIIKSLEIRIPKERVVQDKIAKILSSIDSKISLNNRINAELEAMAKTIYDYWFVQFDFPTPSPSGRAGVGSPYKASGGKMVWSEELKREIPEGWDVKQLKDFAKTGSGGTPLSTVKAYYENGTIPWINSGEVNEPFIVKAEKFITEEGLNNSSAKLFKKGTILMAMYGATAGKVSLMDIAACTNQAICAINTNEEFYRIYIKYGLEDLYRYLVNLSSGSARDNLSQDKIRDLKFVIPQTEILQHFHETVNTFMMKILVNMKENQKLTELRDWLLPMLMNGQIKIKDAEQELAMAAEPGVNYNRNKI